MAASTPSSHLTGPIHIPWLSDPSIAIYPVIMADIWQWTPLMFLIFLSGLVALPDDQMNQARILGAGFWHQLRYLVLPMMKPIILIALIIRAMEVFKIFDSAWLLTQGGPGDATSTISVFLYRRDVHQRPLGLRERRGDHRADHRQRRRHAGDPADRGRAGGTLEQLMTTEGEIDVQSVDEAIEAEAAA